ncbi:MAG TPA: hypothetical protein PLB21_10620, partial [Actinomycetota bacterium]|nr:hypothetical protein [Actinomycetota bacterium]
FVLLTKERICNTSAIAAECADRRPLRWPADAGERNLLVARSWGGGERGLSWGLIFLAGWLWWQARPAEQVGR